MNPATVQDRSPVLQVCTFMLGEQVFGVDVSNIQELVRSQEITTIPLACSAIHGLINLRGQIVTVIDLRERLGLPPRNNSQPPMNVVIHTPNGLISLLVDTIGDVVDVAEIPSEPPPANSGHSPNLIDRVYKCDQELLLLLNTDRTVQFQGRE